MTSVDSLTYDLKDLLAVDIAPLAGQDLESVTQRNCQLLINKIYLELPRSTETEGVCVVLPTGNSLPLPREKPIPPPKKKTRWEIFAEKKGIKKEKRSRMIFDETTNSYKPRWGMDSSAKNKRKAEEAILEYKPGEDDCEDLFERKIAERQLKKSKQGLRELRNRVEAAGETLPSGVVDLEDNKTTYSTNSGRTKSKGGLDEAIHGLERSTASLGRFDFVPKQEKKALKDGKLKKTVLKKQHHLLATTNNEVDIEQKKMLKIADRIFKGEEDGVIKMNKQKLKNVSVEEPKDDKPEKRKRRSKSGGSKFTKKRKN